MRILQTMICLCVAAVDYALSKLFKWGAALEIETAFPFQEDDS